MDQGFSLSEMNRRLANLIRLGTVVEADYQKYGIGEEDVIFHVLLPIKIYFDTEYFWIIKSD